jgi:hypothetical protein
VSEDRPDERSDEAAAPPDEPVVYWEGSGYALRLTPELINACLTGLLEYRVFDCLTATIKDVLAVEPTGPATGPPEQLAALSAWVDEQLGDEAHQRQLANWTAQFYLAIAANEVAEVEPGEEWRRQMLAAFVSQRNFLTAVWNSSLRVLRMVLRDAAEAFPDWPTFAVAPELYVARGDKILHDRFQIAWRRPRGSPPHLPAPLPLPILIPQQTFQEAKTVAVAIADGPALRRWTPIEGELALRHAVKGSPLETKLVGAPMLNWLGLPSTVESLRGELQQAGLPAVLLLHVTLGAALDKVLSQRTYVTVSIDELVSAIGWQPRSRAERATMRRRVWRWIALFHHMEVIGRRDGKFRDPDTRELVDTTSRDALVQIVGRQMPKQLAFDDSTPPLEVTYVAGPWIEQWKGDHRLLTYLGDVRKLASIPAGKPSGAWAQAIGLALNQCWRERASYAELGRVGEDKKLTVRFDPFTRRQLLDLFPPTPSVGEVLEGPHPARAREYWDEGIKHLQRKRIISHYAELASMEVKRKGWAEGWLDQPLDIRPSKAETEAIATIASRARARKKALAAKRRSKQPSES